MDFGALLRRTWDLVWEHKYLILLGVLVALSSGAGTSGSGFRFGERGFEFDGAPPQFRDLPRRVGLPKAAIVILVLVIVTVGVILGLALWVVSTLARGGLIAGVNTVVGGGTSSFGQAFSAGWQKGWRLIGIGILPAIPGLIAFVAGLGLSGTLFGVVQLFDIRAVAMGRNVALLFGALLCLVAPIALILGLLRTFANRACMLEDLGIFAAYARGWEVLVNNLGSAVVLFLIQIGLGIAIALVTALPSVLFALCCILWPLLLLVQGAIATYFSALWTLAWRQWTKTEGDPIL
ncbi:MAG: DUF7544 domain-containing protein [Anaerolineae bacterium]